VKLLSLTLKNFKGVKSFSLDAQGENVSVYGDNATGKTTIPDAFQWLLFDKDSANRKDFDIKTLMPDGTPIHNLEHEVSATLEVDGKAVLLRKVYSEKWTKKRGSATSTFTGHTTDYFIDGVPVKKGEYEARIAEIANEKIFKLLTSPSFFNEQLHWEERRKILLEVCGDISDSDVIASDESLSELSAILQGRSLDDHKKVIKSRLTEINRELDKIPVRIDEVTMSLPDTSGLNKEEIIGSLEAHKDMIRKKEQQIARIEEGGEIAEKTKLIREIEGSLIEIRNEHGRRNSGIVQEKQSELMKVKETFMDTKSEVYSLESDIKRLNGSILLLNDKIESLRKDWFAVDAEKFEISQETVCPTCGQNIPENQLIEAREKALAAFNQKKAERLERISKEGCELKKQKESEEKAKEETKENLQKAKARMEQGEKAVTALQKEVDDLQTQTTNYTDDPAYIQKLQEKEAIEKDIESLKAGRTEEVNEIRKDIAALESSAREMEKNLANIEAQAKGIARIRELSEQQKELAKEYERLEKELFLTEEFTRAKVKMLEERINSRFRFARFKMFDLQVNGGISECCTTLYNGVPYGKNLNSGHEIIVGMDIIRTLSEYYGFVAPIFVDNAESVTKLPEMDAQVIRLVKPEISSEEDRKKYSKLNVEYESKKLVKEAV